MDDYRQDRLTKGVVELGVVQTGTIEQPGDADWFRVDMELGYTYRIVVAGDGSTPLPAAGLELWLDQDTAAPWQLAGYAPLPSSLTRAFDVQVAPPPSLVAYNGIEFLSVAGLDAQATGQYSIRVSLVDDYHSDARTGGSWNPLRAQPGSFAPASQPIAVEQWGAIETPFDRDWFRVDMVVGRTYRFELAGYRSGQLDGLPVLSDTVLRLYDSAGGLAAAVNEQRQFIEALEFTAGQSGRYFVSAAGRGSLLGRYHIRFQTVDDFVGHTSTNGLISVGNPAVQGDIEYYQDADWFRVSLQQGHWYRVHLVANDTSAGPPSLQRAGLLIRDDQLQIVDILRTASELRFEFSAERTTDHFLIVRGQAQWNSHGAYRLRIDEIPSPAVDVADPPLDFESAARSSLDAETPPLSPFGLDWLTADRAFLTLPGEPKPPYSNPEWSKLAMTSHDAPSWLAAPTI
jgi:hypothetical protein